MTGETVYVRTGKKTYYHTHEDCPLLPEEHDTRDLAEVTDWYEECSRCQNGTSIYNK